MPNKKKKAIALLKQQRAKLTDRENHNDNWYAMVMALIAKYIGETSSFHEIASSGYSYSKKGAPEAIREAKELLDNVITYLDVNGLRKENSIWRRIEGMNQKLIYTILIGIGVSLFTLGTQFTKLQTIHQENQLVKENIRLKEDIAKQQAKLDALEEQLKSQENKGKE